MVEPLFQQKVEQLLQQQVNYNFNFNYILFYLELVEQLLQQQVNELLQQQNWSTNFSNERSINFSNNKCSRATVQEKYDKNFK
ncbi:unnamed protein product [Rotaria magnacalcarata]